MIVKAITIAVIATSTLYQKGDLVRVGKCTGEVVRAFESHYQLRNYQCPKSAQFQVWVHVDDINGEVPDAN